MATKIDVNIHDFSKRFQKEYDFLYNHGNNDEYSFGFDEAVTAFDRCMEEENFKNFVCEFVSYRGDYLTSDRECAAFMFALVDMI